MFDLWLNITIRAKIIENITNDILLPGTMKFQGMNKHSTGNNIAAIIDPIDTILNTIMIINANTRQINPILQLIIINTPNDVATPLPPLKLKKHGNVCPNTKPEVKEEKVESEDKAPESTETKTEENKD